MFHLFHLLVTALPVPTMLHILCLSTLVTYTEQMSCSNLDWVPTVTRGYLWFS